MKQNGFSLIEIIVAMAISAGLSLILYRAFSQTTRLTQQVRDMINDNSDTLSSYAQLEKDFSAIFVPAKEEVPKAPTAAPPAQQPGQKAPEPKPEAAKPEPPVFTTTQSEGKLATISFVTTNAFTIFDEAPLRSVRVTYRFKPQTGEAEPAGTKLYTLVREEIPYDQKAETEKKEQKPVHAYALIRNISTYALKFSARDCQKKDTKELVSLSQWGTDEQKKKCPDLKLPEFVEFTFDIFDLVTHRTVAHILSIAIPAAGCPKIEPPKPAAAVQQPAQQAGQQPAQQQAITGPRSNIFRAIRVGG